MKHLGNRNVFTEWFEQTQTDVECEIEILVDDGRFAHDVASALDERAQPLGSGERIGGFSFLAGQASVLGWVVAKRTSPVFVRSSLQPFDWFFVVALRVDPNNLLYLLNACSDVAKVIPRGLVK